MNEVEILMEEVTKRLPETKEYNQYKNLLERLKEQPDLYHRVGEFRRRSIMLQMSEKSCKMNFAIYKIMGYLVSFWQQSISIARWCGGFRKSF